MASLFYNQISTLHCDG